MFRTDELEKNLIFLRDSALARKTKQGLIVYNGALNELNKAKSKEEFNKVLEDVYDSLSGIDAHGYFTDEEYECVTQIRALKQF